MRRIIFVNRFYWPAHTATGQLLTDLARALAAQKIAVLVITSRSAVAAVPIDELDQGVRIRRVAVGVSGNLSILRKAFDFGTFFCGSLWRLGWEAKRDDTVVIMTDPPLLGVAAWLVARLKRAQVVHWIQDIYPDVAIALTGHRVLGVFTPARNLSWRHADHCVTISSELASVVHAATARSSRISVIANWAPHGLVRVAPDDSRVTEIRRTWGVEGKFVVQYSGNLGRVHDLRPLLGAAELLRDAANVAFVIIGDGAQRAALAAEATARQLGNLTFLPPQDRQSLALTLAASDLHVITLRPGCERCVYPSKFHGIIAAGKPILFIGPIGCEQARLITSQELGCAVCPDDAQAIATRIRELASDPTPLRIWSSSVVQYANSHSERESISQWLDLLRHLGSCRQ